MRNYYLRKCSQMPLYSLKGSISQEGTYSAVVFLNKIYLSSISQQFVRKRFTAPSTTYYILFNHPHGIPSIVSSPVPDKTTPLDPTFADTPEKPVFEPNCRFYIL